MGVTVSRNKCKTLSTTPDEYGMVHRVVIKNDIMARASRKVVLPGRLIGSLRAGDRVVVKVLEDCVPDEDYWKRDIKRCARLRKYIIKYCEKVNPPLEMRVLYPMAAYIDKVSDYLKQWVMLKKGEWVLVEDFLDKNYSLFMDRTGNVEKKMPSHEKDVLAELVHFTYSESKGKEVFCGLQGALTNSRLTLAEPTVHTADQSEGELDQGLEGILAVFDHHKCTPNCKNWLKPEGVCEPEDVTLSMREPEPEVVTEDVDSDGLEEASTRPKTADLSHTELYVEAYAQPKTSIDSDDSGIGLEDDLLPEDTRMFVHGDTRPKKSTDSLDSGICVEVCVHANPDT